MPLERNRLATIVDTAIQEFQGTPVDILDLGNANGELAYLINQRDSYIKTAEDIWQIRPVDAQPVRVLEIGAFLGVLSITLSKMGYQVTAVDIPEFMSNERLQHKFTQHDVEFRACNLKEYVLSFPDDTFDIVIMCQVLEHLNFNPLPVIQELNRILKTNGLLYLALPNVASLKNRIKLLFGESIHPSIQDYFAQLDPKQNMIVGLHWREYTGAEVKEMLERLGFRIDRQDYDYQVSDMMGVASVVARVFRSRMDARQLPGKAWRYLTARAWRMIQNVLTRLFPQLRGNITTYAVKAQTSRRTFFFTDATRPTRT